MLSNKYRVIFWGLLVLSVFFIWVIKFSAWRNMHTSEMNSLAWFTFGYEFGEIIFNLCMAYIASSIFSFVVVYLPDKKKEESAMKIIQGRLTRIAKFMEISTHYFLLKHDLSGEIDEDKIKEGFEKIQTLDSDNKMNFYYQLPNKSQEILTFCNTGDYDELKYFLDQAKIIQSEINKMYKIPLINNVEHDLRVVLEEINRCRIFKSIKLLKEYKNQNINTPEIGNDIYQYFYLYKKLLKFVGPTNITFTQSTSTVNCWCDIDIKLGARQYRTLSKS